FRAAHRARGRAHVHRLPGLRPQALLGLPGARADGHAATRLPPRPHRHRPRVARRAVRLSATPQTRNQGNPILMPDTTGATQETRLSVMVGEPPAGVVDYGAVVA